MSGNEIASPFGPLPNNLPIPLTSFIGRTQELRDLACLLQSVRLLTLIGPGGAGKTRLATEVGSRVSGIGGLASNDALSTPVSRLLTRPFADGVWLVELAGLRDPALVPRAVAVPLGVREIADRSAVESLIDALRAKQLLLILDNCEHLVSACAHLTELLLQQCPELHILATSRQALGVGGERLWRVPPLSLPRGLATRDRVGRGAEHSGLDGSSPLAQAPVLPPEAGLIGSPLSSPESFGEAVQLFVDRATLHSGQFALTEANVDAVGQICGRLDGLPLAIELAASWISLLPPAEIAARLEDRFRLLVGGHRTSPLRQQTLRAAVDWSYDLLSECEQRLFNRLSVFAGSFGLGAVEWVGGELTLLRGLVEKSLIISEIAGAEARFRLLETLREYGRERLRRAGEAELVRDRHAAYYLAVAETASHALFGHEQGAWLERLEGEHDNLRAARRWFAEQGEHENELRLVAALWRFWYLRGHLREGQTNLEAALQRGVNASPSAKAKALNGAGILAWFLGEVSRAAVLHAEALPLCRAAGDRRELALCLNMQGLVARTRGELARAAALCLEARAICEVLDDSWGIAFSHYLLGEIAYFRADHQQAVDLWLHALALFRECGDLWGIAYASINLGNAHRFFGDLDQARTRFEEGLEICRTMGDPWGIAYSLASLGEVRRDRGEYPQAMLLSEESLARRRELGDQIGIARSLDTLAGLALRLGDPQRAEQLLREGLQAYAALQYQRGIARCLGGFVELAMARGEFDRAARLAGAAETLRTAISVRLSAADAQAHERRVGSLRKELGDAALNAALEEGRALDADAAVAFALSAPAGLTPRPPSLEMNDERKGETDGAEGAGARIPTPWLPSLKRTGRAAESEQTPARDGANLSPQSSALGPRGGLTTRELEVLALIAAGCSNKEIARQLWVSLRTVEHHITSIYSKIGARSKADATAYYLRLSAASPSEGR
jgi:predicted ATPase/DNA-binding CsgD family transcriptional regulator